MNTLRLIPEHGGEPIAIDKDRVVIGRDPASDVHLQDASVSRLHAEIQRNDNGWTIADLDSGNGVLIDGVRTPSGVLLPGQSLEIGSLRFRVEVDRGDDGATLILDRSPLDASDSTMIHHGPPGGSWPLAANSEPRTGALVMAGMAGGLVVLVGMLLAAPFFVTWRAPDTAKAPSPAPPPAAAPPATGAALPATAPIVAAPTPAVPSRVSARSQPSPARARPKARLLISTDRRAVVFVDGRRKATLQAGGRLRMDVSPGDHVVSFRIGKARHDRRVRTRANQQSVVRFAPKAAAPAASKPPDESRPRGQRDDSSAAA